ncbi:TKL protein kinase [Saprolegnia diclina VS20]|uniref:TKL protein kinase n=1 Tax=Saprolegnia diclina (strain VS20) TaxID=1156394 RepID=T0QGE1_SAPDV|nr:TKL protein kinase [Saprolegnia diclina VS20]EQC37019.1 TKL protein kinase [Saprolegnia diclina VS20]|eukprot:XP_008609800.1 TKL protein kinase [Saprolegnia diclina VS20]
MPALLLDLMDFGNLRSYLDEKHRRQETFLHVTSLEVAWVVANAMKALHALGIVHRDIKSENVLLSSTHYIKLGDLGIAKVAATYMTDGRGTIRWTAPEVLRVDGQRYGTEADVYSFGVLLSELDTLQLPFDDATDLKTDYLLKQAVLAGRRPTLTKSCKPWLRDLATQCLNAEPSKRPTASKIVEMLGKQVAEGSAADALEAFRRAVAVDAIALVQAQLEDGFNPNYSVKGDVLPLSMAVGLRKYDITQLLLDHGALPDSYCYGGTPLHEAAGECYTSVEMLINAGANVDALDKKHRTALYWAVKRNHELNMRILLDAGANAAIANKGGKTPLALAMSKEHLVRLAPVLEGAVAAQATSDSMRLCPDCKLVWHPIDAACSCGHDAPMDEKIQCAVHRLITSHHRGVLVDWTRKCVPCGHSFFVLKTACPMCNHKPSALANPLGVLLKRLKLAPTTPPKQSPKLGHVVAWLRRVEAEKKRAAKAKLDKSNAAYNHFKALVGAIQEGNLEKLKALLGKSVPQQQSDVDGNSLVHHAVKQNNLAMLKVLLATPGVPIDHTNTLYETPLAVATFSGACDLVRALYAALHPSSAPTSDAATFTSPYVLPMRPDAMLMTNILRYKLEMQVPGSRLEVWPTKLQLAIVAANALADLHAAGLVHGSFSSFSIYINPPATSVHVMYPGFEPANVSLALWTAPEVRVAQQPPSSASDMYALGVLLTELDTLAIPSAHVGRLRDDCERWYADMVASCVAEDPATRMSAADVVAQLQPHVDAATQEAKMFEAFQAVALPLQIDAATKLLDDGLRPDAVCPWSTQSLLCAAIKSMSLELVHLVLKRGADVNKPLDFFGSALLFATSSVCSHDIVAALIAAGADVHVTQPVHAYMTPSHAGNTPLINAVYFGFPQVVAAVAYADLTTLLARNKDGETALEVALRLREASLYLDARYMLKQPVEVTAVLEDAECWRSMLVARGLPMTTARGCADCGTPLSIEDMQCRKMTCGVSKAAQSIVSSTKKFFSAALK